MKVKVTKETVIITECSCVNEGEVCVNECLFQLPECFDGLSVTAAFNNIPVPVINGKCNIPSLKKGTAVLGVYAYKENEDGIELMYSPKPTAFFVNAGSYSDETAVESIPTISEFEQFCKGYAQEIIEIITAGGNSELFGKIETTENKTNEIDAQSTYEKYPSAKAVYDFVKNEGASFSVVENPKVWELEDGCYYASGFVAIDTEAGFYVYDKTLLFVATDEENTAKKRFVLFLNCANDFPYGVVNGETDGTSSEWHGVESEFNKVEKIDNTSRHTQYPSAKAVYDFVVENQGGSNTGTVVAFDYDKTVKAVAHRGYSTIAPENTLVAYQLAKQTGFSYAECDVAFTKDNVAVLLHDSTIDRTSDGSGNITSLTYEQLLQYDFGSWKSSEYAGTKIPTFEEFIKLCKNIGLHPYIELKDGGNYTQAQIQSIVDMVKKYGMQGNVTYISFSVNFLNYVKSYDEKARLGYLADITSSTITTANGLKTEENEVYMGVYYKYITDEKVQMCINNNLPLEVWTVNEQTEIENMNSYITGVTSDYLIAGKVLYEKYIGFVFENDNGGSGDDNTGDGGDTGGDDVGGDDSGGNNDTETEWIAVEYTECGGYFNYDGDFVWSTTVANTGFVGVGEATKIKFTASVAKQHNVVFFDADKKYISCTALTDIGTHITDIPANASFFSVAYYIEEKDTINICANGNTVSNNDGNEDDIDDGYTVVKTLGSDDIMFGYGITDKAPNYYSEYPIRAIYGNFDIPVEYGYTYKFKAISNIPTAQMGCRFYSESVLNTVQGGVNNITYGEYFDPGWQELTTEIEIPEFINNSPTACVRLSFRMDTTDKTNVIDGFIESVIISRKPKADINDYTVVKTLGADDIMYRAGNSFLSPNYYEVNPRRAGYYNFDIPIEYGYIYKFDAVSTISTAQMGTQFYNGVVLNAVENNTNFEGTNVYDPGWQNLETKIEAPQYINNSPIEGVRLTFRIDTNNTEISDGIANSKPIQSVTVSRKPVQV